MEDLVKIAVPAAGILSAAVTHSGLDVTLKFDDPMSALRFSIAVRQQLQPSSNQYHHVIINEEMGGRSFAHHLVLVTTGDEDPHACAQHMAATLNGDDDDAPITAPDENGSYLINDARVSVLSLKTLSNLDGQALARHLRVAYAEDMPINRPPSQSHAKETHRG